MRRTSRFLALIALLAAGCAHGRAAPPEPRPPAATEPGSGTGSSTTPSTEETSGAPALDPSETITAEELATIPDPVPGGTIEPPIDPAAPSQESPAPPVGGAPGAGQESTVWIWRVQIFASPDRSQAERTAREASDRLGEPYVLDHEGSLYKVRLGVFPTEAGADPLKRRAVLEGYVGAFRVRTAQR